MLLSSWQVAAICLKRLSTHFSSDFVSFLETMEIGCKGGIWNTSIGRMKVSYMVISEYKDIEIRRGLACETSFIKCFYGPRYLLHPKTKRASRTWQYTNVLENLTSTQIT